MEVMQKLKDELNIDFKVGLILAGGGAKGAYQIGVLKALEEYKIMPFVTNIAGTSVGALNAILFPLGFSKAKSIWDEIKSDTVLHYSPIEKLSNYLNRKTRLFKLLNKEINTIENYISQTGIFSRTPLREVIEQYLDLSIIFKKIESYHIGVFDINEGYKNICITKDNHNKQDLVDLLLASSAIPFAFPPQEYRGKLYCDGGLPILGQNFPVKALKDTCDFIIGVDMSSISSNSFFSNRSKCDVYIASESHFHDGLSNVFDFSDDKYNLLLELGYNDGASTILRRIREESEKRFEAEFRKKEKIINYSLSAISKKLKKQDIDDELKNISSALELAVCRSDVSQNHNINVA